jgi:lipopolysaccharide biosynthesis glycosyltransferase
MLHVAYCFDKNYRQHFGAAGTSLLSNGGHAGREMIVHVISDEFDEALASKLVALRSRFQVTIK